MAYNGAVVTLCDMHCAAGTRGLATCVETFMLSKVFPLLLSMIERNALFTNCHLFLREKMMRVILIESRGSC
jgi:hypothetical protein